MRATREIEVKLKVVSGHSFNEVCKAVQKAFKGDVVKSIKETSSDYYWSVPKGCRGDFCRVRSLSEGGAQLTVKYTDKGTNLDRIEVDVHVKDPIKAEMFLSTLFNRPKIGEVTKTYHLMFLDKKEHENNVSVYQIRGTKDVYIEIEATSIGKLNSYIKYLNEKLHKSIKFKREKRSLFKIYVAK